MIIKYKKNLTHKILNRKNNDSIFFSIHISPILKQGLLRALEPHEIETLIALACFIDKSGKCFPSISQLSSILGISRQAVQGRINSLRKKKFSRKPVLQISKRKASNGFNRNEYQLSPLLGISIFNRSSTPCSSRLDSSGLEHNYTHVSNYNHINNNTHTEGVTLKKYGKEIDPIIEPFTKFIAEQDKSLKGNLQKATKRVHFHIQKLGKENWLDCYKLQNRLGIYFYNFITYKVIQKKKSYEKALKEWDQKQT